MTFSKINDDLGMVSERLFRVKPYLMDTLKHIKVMKNRRQEVYQARYHKKIVSFFT